MSISSSYNKKKFLFFTPNYTVKISILLILFRRTKYNNHKWNNRKVPNLCCFDPLKVAGNKDIDI